MKILDDNKNLLIEKYNSGISVQALARLYSCNDWTVKNFLKKNNIKTRSKNDLKIKFNKSFLFSKTAETYYFWGFMLGDGSLIHHKKGHKYLSVTIHEKDECILSTFCDWLEMPYHHIKHGQNNFKTKWSRLNLYGEIFKQDFSEFGFIPRKTYNPIIPNINYQFIRPFILGLIDADGSVAWHKLRTNNKFPQRKETYEYSISLVGHPLVINWVELQLRQLGFNGNINSQIVKNKWKRIRIQNKADILSLVKLLQINLYQHFLLKRKWNSLLLKLAENNS